VVADIRDDALRALLEQQITYYRMRAPEYDHWWNRTHQYALDPDRHTIWTAEVGVLHDWLDELPLGGDVLELACGTGTWTGLLAQRASSVTAVDASPEMIDINRSKPGTDAVRFVEADLFEWTPDDRYDAVFFGFWISHVPPARFDRFWETLRAALRPGGVVAFVDNLFRTGSDWPPERPDGFVEARTDLSDGSRHEIVKVYFEPDELAADLDQRGWASDIRATDTFFLHGSARQRSVSAR
jgi:demethylmenaquinone methyltransferase/2-methoxy-6-polyprenyl-1,4-benzoquinol methylase